MRKAEINRKTAETEISLTLDLDGSGRSQIDTGCGFLDHMLTLFAKHSKFDLTVKCVGDINVDYHHTTEDVGICLGMAFKQAVGSMAGIERYGDVALPMDEALILCAVDISGRGYLGCELGQLNQKVGDFDTELVDEFFAAFIRKAEISLHFQRMAGVNTHHIIEGAFKAFGVALRRAVKIDDRFKDEIPSTKGVL